MAHGSQLVRHQHVGFGKEIRSLLSSKTGRDRELVGIVVSEIEELARNKAAGQPHKNERRLSADLREVGYLSLYGQGHSVRVYFSVKEGVLWMLAIDAGKRRTKLTDSMKGTLKNRLTEIG